MAAALAPASSLRLRPHSAARFFSVYSTRNPRNVPISFKTLTNHLLFPPLVHRYTRLHQFSRARTDISISIRRCFCSVISGSLSSGEAVETANLESIENMKLETGEKVREFRKRLRIADIKGGPDEGLDRLGQKLVVRGWVRTLRVQSSVTFIEVNDGSCLSNMQCVMNSDAEGYDQVESGFITTGASVWIQGTLVSSQGSKQKVELKVEKVEMVGKSDPSFPIQKKRVSREFLRTKAHLRPRTNTFSAVARVRNALAYATHKFFQENGFVWISSPIITASDCEGAGEQFCVTTLIPSSREGTDSPVDTIPKTDDGLIDWSQHLEGFWRIDVGGLQLLPCTLLESVYILVVETGKNVVEGFLRIDVGCWRSYVAFRKNLEDRCWLLAEDFFGKPAFLTVSGQLNAETYATALSDVYTFGPTFRAENSNTSRHLAEFWMIEPELAFADLNDDMACATAYLQYVVRYVLENCKEDMDFFNTWIEKGIVDRLSDVAEKNFVQLTYTDAIELLLRAKKNFEFPVLHIFPVMQTLETILGPHKPLSSIRVHLLSSFRKDHGVLPTYISRGVQLQVKWGCDLQSEHERYVTEEVFAGCPEIKAFYMRQNDDGKTVAAMDLLVPRVISGYLIPSITSPVLDLTSIYD
ncbi:hypothetical protein HHK36_000388 [Tetracentron sinense]|uniref:Asparagine--tRNA ligase n=1 Tax=Tetracentron sinense TaxID=13715 RepID=A0A834ZR00_TETSI|nr:hypothetical protein HHK36_000388 [Tetracentron sinense]